MKLIKTILIFFFHMALSSILLNGCINPPNYDVKPKIKFLSISPTYIIEKKTTVYITFSFTDGDGDIGYPDSEDIQPATIFLTDSRNPALVHSFNPDYITPTGKYKGISGEIVLMRPYEICLNGNNANDTLYYEIQLKDRAGNLSNIVKTPSVVIECDR